MQYNLLRSKHPILADPNLAKRIGLNEAIILQKFSYLINYNIEHHNPRSYHNGKYWTFNTYKTWHEKYFNWWGLNTVKRTIKSLKSQKLIETNNFNHKGFDNTKWYTINYDNPILDSYMNDNSTTQNGTMSVPESNSDQYQNGTYNTTYYPQTNRETKNSNLMKLKRKIHDTFNVVNSNTLNLFEEWLSDLSLDLMLHGLDEAQRYNAQDIKYVYSIYDKWKAQDIHSLNDLEASKAKSPSDPKHRNVNQPQSSPYKSHEELKKEDEEQHKEFEEKVARPDKKDNPQIKTQDEVAKDNDKKEKKQEDRIIALIKSGKSFKQIQEEMEREDQEKANEAVRSIHESKNKKKK